MEPFKNQLNADVVHALARVLHRARPDFDRAGFEGRALDGLEGLELKARAEHLADALQAYLPTSYVELAPVIESCLAPPDRSAADSGSGAGPAEGLSGWAVWPLAELVARRGLDAPARALETLHALTQRFTAEWAIRPFIERFPDLVFATLRQWTHDPSEHVRRLVSEGSRPRLPWGRRLASLQSDPSPTLPLLAALQDDPSEYVRRSVANHLNDIAKDHPDRVVDWVRMQLPGAGPERRALLRHASRTLVKSGHPAMLALWGAGEDFAGRVQLSVQPRRIHLGEAIRIEVGLHSRADAAQRLVVDYAVHHVKADGSLRPKVFKGWTLELAPRASCTLSKRHAVRPVTVRRYHAGRHALDLRINGRVVAHATFELRLG